MSKLGQSLGMIFLVFLIITISNAHRPTSIVRFAHCHLPDDWFGWWRSDQDAEATQLVNISSDFMDGKGQCVQSHKDYFVFVQKNVYGEMCTSCLMLIAKHYNVLRYKEYIQCSRNAKDMDVRDLQAFCDNIEPHSQFQSLYRLDSPIYEECPFNRERYSLAYRRTNTCRSPFSEAYICADRRGTFLKYEACHDIAGSESDQKILTCNAAWRDGEDTFIIGTIRSKRRDEEHLRCFSYKKLKINNTFIGYRVAQSGTSSCNGLDLHNAHGDEDFELIIKDEPRCEFPKWLRGDWQFLNNDSLRIDYFSGHIFLEKVNYPQFKVVNLFMCRSITYDSLHEHRVVVAGTYLIGCQRWFVNTVIYRRGRYVLQIESHMAREHHEWNDVGQNISQTIIANSKAKVYVKADELKTARVVCPINSGKYIVTESGTSLTSSCGPTGEMTIYAAVDEIKFYCSNRISPIAVLYCRARWIRHEYSYFIASGVTRKDSQFRCFKHLRQENVGTNNLLYMESSTYNCDGEFYFNVAKYTIEEISAQKLVMNLTEPAPASYEDEEEEQKLLDSQFTSPPVKSSSPRLRYVIAVFLFPFLILG